MNQALSFEAGTNLPNYSHSDTGIQVMSKVLERVIKGNILGQ